MNRQDFNPHDPYHITLQLLQEMHSERLQRQLECDLEREKTKQEMLQNTAHRKDLVAKNEKLTGLELNIKSYTNALREIAGGRGKAAVKAAQVLAHVLENKHKWGG